MKINLRTYITIIILCFSFGVFSQKAKPTLENFQKNYNFQKSKDYSGPKNIQGEEPASMDEKNNSGTAQNNSTNNYSPQQIQKARLKKQNYSKNGGRNQSRGGSGQGGSGEGDGDQPLDPEMGKPKPIEFDTPDVDAPDLNLPDINSSGISSNFWKALLIIILSILVLFIVYYLVKNYKPKNKKFVSEITENEWNPELISKSELEMRLEDAMNKKDYRECVRIYFTFILKEMIRINRIKWKKEFTNYDYILQSKSHKNSDISLTDEFEESVKIYDLVWYGEYEINREDYDNLAKHLDKNYKQLTKENA